MAQNDKMFVTLHLSGNIHRMIVIFGALCKMMTSLDAFFFFFFKVLIFQIVRGGGGVKGKKWPKMTKKICLSHSASQELYLIVVFGTLV